MDVLNLSTGLDASTDMLALSRANAARAGTTNARFLHGHIEDIPLPAGSDRAASPGPSSTRSR
jgi:ubiquinone/menaquinone biosynthesis C-methylase UbiE